MTGLRALRDFAETHPDAASPLDDWYKTVTRLRWNSIFNIGGNKYRLAVFIKYQPGRVYIRHVMTHQEYERRFGR
ncbi:MAG: type II toxin-antitoxin system HigB family toxin [Bryobacteraceae bacterium]